MKNREDGGSAKLKNIDDILHLISRMDQAADENELSAMIPALLESIGHYAGADRVYVFDWASEREERFQNTYEWCAPGISPEIENLQDVPLEVMPVWLNTFRENRSIVIRDLEAAAETMPDEYALLKPQSIHSLIAVPVYAIRKLKGFIGIDNPDLDDEHLSIRILSDVGGHLGSIRENLRMFRILEAERTDLRKKNLTLSGLSLDYAAIFSINLDTGRYAIDANLPTNNAFQYDHARRRSSGFETFIEWYAQKFVLPEYREEFRQRLSLRFMKERFEAESDYHFSYESTPNGAGQSCFQVHIVKKYDSDGRFAIIGFRCVDDVVERERHYKQLLQDQLDMIAFAMPGGVKISSDDENYSFKYVSEQCSRMLGYAAPEEMIKAGRGSMVGLAHPEDVEENCRSLAEQYSRHDFYDLTYRVKCADGSYKYIEDRGRRVRAADGTVEHWSLLLDKNDLMEKTIALESEKKANQSKSAFLSRMSHDIRTPLNGIIGLLKIDAAHAEDRSLVDANREKMQVAANHLLSLINDVLQMSKIEDGGVVLSREVVNLRELFQEIHTIIEERAEENGIRLELRPQERDALAAAYVYGSPLHLRQIFLNIYENSIKYNRPGGKITTAVEYSESGGIGTGRWEISDTGIGMSKDFLEHIFEPFTQERQDARSVYQGTGLGMAITKGLVDQMGGTIAVSSEEGQGTTFVVTIPFKTARETEYARDCPTDEAGDIAGLRLLLAEDNALNAEIALALLNDEGAEVTVVRNGQEAVDAFQGQPEGTFDAILLDIMMPVMDGLTAAKTIRALKRADAKAIPILAMTANAFAEDREACAAAGMNAHLSKPLNIETVKRVICGCANRNRKQPGDDSSAQF